MKQQKEMLQKQVFQHLLFLVSSPQNTTLPYLNYRRSPLPWNVND